MIHYLDLNIDILAGAVAGLDIENRFLLIAQLLELERIEYPIQRVTGFSPALPKTALTRACNDLIAFSRPRTARNIMSRNRVRSEESYTEVTSSDVLGVHKRTRKKDKVFCLIGF